MLDEREDGMLICGHLSLSLGMLPPIHALKVGLGIRGVYVNSSISKVKL